LAAVRFKPASMWHCTTYPIPGTALAVKVSDSIIASTWPSAAKTSTLAISRASHIC